MHLWAPWKAWAIRNAHQIYHRTLPKDMPSDASIQTIDKNIYDLAWPTLVEQVLVTLVSMVSTMMVGHLGTYAVAAVGLCTQPRFVFLAAFMALNVGTTALVARMKGAGDQAQANLVLRQAILLSTFLSIIFSVIGVVFSREIIILMGAEADTLEPATAYMRIQMYGLFFSTMSLTITAALRGVGNTKASMNLNIISNLVNVVLNYCLVYGNLGFPRLEVAGSSLATVIGSMVSFALAMWMLFSGRQFISLSLKESYRPHWPTLSRIFHIGFPAMLEQLAMRIGMLTYVRTVTGLGTVVLATHQIVLNIHSMSFTVGNAFSMATTAMVGQSLGQERPDLAQTYIERIKLFGNISAVFIMVSIITLSRPLMMLYSNDPTVLVLGSLILKIVALIQPFQSTTFVYSGGLRGAGDSRGPAVATIVGMLGLRPAIAFAMVNWLGWGLVGAWIALIIDQLARLGIVTIRFHKGKWLTVKV